MFFFSVLLFHKKLCITKESQAPNVIYNSPTHKAIWNIYTDLTSCKNVRKNCLLNGNGAELTYSTYRKKQFSIFD